MKKIGILGASSNIGYELVRSCFLHKLEINLFENKTPIFKHKDNLSIYKNFSNFLEDSNELISVIPIWILRDLLTKNKSKIKFKRIVLLSSTSASTKIYSENIWEQNYAKKFLEAEADIKKLCTELNIKCLILRPSMIWGNKKDLNITFIMKFIVRYGFLILPSKGKGIRYPIHVYQLASSILDIYFTKKEGLFNILGPEKLTYYKMCEIIFLWYGYQPLIIFLPEYLQKFVFLSAKFFFRKPYINESSFKRIDYTPLIEYGNPINYYASGRFRAYKNDLLKEKFFANFIQKIFSIFKSNKRL